MLNSALPRRTEARWILAGTLLSAVGRGLTLPFLFVYLSDVRELSGTQAGLVIGWYGAVGLVLSPVGGALIDRFGARRVVVSSLLVEAVGTGALALVHTVGTAFAVMSAVAVGNASVLAGQSTILTRLTGADERQRVFGLHFTLLNLGIGLGGVVAGALVDTARPGTFQAVYLIDAVSFLAPVVILLALPGVSDRHRTPEKEEVRPASGGARSGGYAAVLRDRPFRRLVGYGLVLTTCGYAQIQVGFPAFATRVVEVTPRIVAWALAGNTVVIVVSQLLMIRLMERRSRSGVLAVVGVTFAAAWLVLGLGGVVAEHHALLAAVCVAACAAVFGFGETMLSPVLPVLTNALATDELRGRYNSFTSVIFGIGGVIGPVTAGPLLTLGGGTVWAGLVTAGCLVASLLALTLRPLLSADQDGRIIAQAPADGRTFTSS
ncbi:MFS transporter [Streptomyces sp. TG1A-8]|uniref:MFS transporter n=1 Tax=Streptomyces sp. TG1A-8 TaxID=3051385 RepID=UPI00265C0989|nr:MFS transporter [Streptomyces sp. TG1A-8]MDO0924233.1 MFS transporter [Streptomyces sp. TG1A-8]